MPSNQKLKQQLDDLESDARMTEDLYREQAQALHPETIQDQLDHHKAALRLPFEGEDLRELTDNQLKSVIEPSKLCQKYQARVFKKESVLRKLKETQGHLRYLKSLNADEEAPATCPLCLEQFGGSDRAFLCCGHSFHENAECFGKLQAGGNIIECPICRFETNFEDIMVASKKDQRFVQGSWGTKVTRLVSDVLGIRDKGEKGVMFSQWGDMLDIIQLALLENGITFARAKGLSTGQSVDMVRRTPECTVLLLNMTNTAEGLTLIKASHIFMLEPIMDHALFSQAINRICRIGQQRKTHVWRYIVEDTVKVKIDKKREERQDNQVQTSASKQKPLVFSAGGIDGGFATLSELLQLLEP
jgi:E3 ubiquitin-protein ligase SHPRH